MNFLSILCEITLVALHLLIRSPPLATHCTPHLAYELMYPPGRVRKCSTAAKSNLLIFLLLPTRNNATAFVVAHSTVVFGGGPHILLLLLPGAFEPPPASVVDVFFCLRWRAGGGNFEYIECSSARFGGVPVVRRSIGGGSVK